MAEADEAWRRLGLVSPDWSPLGIDPAPLTKTEGVLLNCLWPAGERRHVADLARAVWPTWEADQAAHALRVNISRMRPVLFRQGWTVRSRAGSGQYWLERITDAERAAGRPDTPSGHGAALQRITREQVAAILAHPRTPVERVAALVGVSRATVATVRRGAHGSAYGLVTPPAGDGPRSPQAGG